MIRWWRYLYDWHHVRKKSRPPQREPTRAPLMCWSSSWRTRGPLPSTRDAFPSYSGHYKSLLNPSANIGMIKNEDSYDFPVFQCLNFQILPCQRCLLHGLRARHVWSQHGGAQSLGDRARRRDPREDLEFAFDLHFFGKQTFHWLCDTTCVKIFLRISCFKKCHWLALI